MRRTYISPEYTNSKVFGSFNMLEESNFFGSKMLEIQDSIQLTNENIIYFQKDTGEQLDFSIESTLPSKIYSSSDDKKNNHSLIIDQSQPKFQLDKNTRWILDINLRAILSNYIFASMKRFRTFQGIKNEMTYSSSVDLAMNDYIRLNILNRYKLNSVNLFLVDKDLRNQSLLRYKNIWNDRIAIESNRFTKFQSETAFDNSTIRLIFSQQKDSSTHSFEYFFNLNFIKV
jgi:hypothetical protein